MWKLVQKCAVGVNKVASPVTQMTSVSGRCLAKRWTHSEQSRKVKIPTIKLINDTKVLQIENGEQNYKYPFVWLRDNCRCSECFHVTSQSRLVDWQKFDVNTSPNFFEFDGSAENLHINWSDGHKSVHSMKWLKEHDFSESNRKRFMNEMYRPPKNLWGKSTYSQVLKRFDFKEVLQSDDALFNWLDALSVNGVAIVENAPLTPLEARRLADRVGFIRRTHYGEEFIVQAKEGTSNVAYLSSTLQPHTDLPYYEYKPGTNLLHCLVQTKSKGGDNSLTDGFYVAERLRRERPEMYKTLASVMVNWNDVGEEDGKQFHSVFRAPVICENRDGVLERINHSIPQRDSQFTVPIEMVDFWYRSLAEFVKIMYEESVHFKTKPGDILTFDNIRLLHGRSSYEDSGGVSRHLVGAYLDWDEIYSRWRVLKALKSQ